MDRKTKRQQTIIKLIEKNRIETQEELAERLSEAGVSVTQATISRDIRELGLEKSASGYRRSGFRKDNSGADTEKYIRVLKEGTQSVESAASFIVVKTVSGMAMAVAAALDELKLPGIVGCIAGDDTIFCALRSAADTGEVMRKIQELYR
ncbi:MAG: arginine repressor [Lachnospiraceae bacterium]|nr:arginine repressor [Lachnospiraceae bacterium]